MQLLSRLGNSKLLSSLFNFHCLAEMRKYLGVPRLVVRVHGLADQALATVPLVLAVHFAFTSHRPSSVAAAPCNWVKA